jgi:hypothetical protein
MESEIIAGLMSLLTATAGFLGAPIDDFTGGSHSHDHSENSGSQLELGSSHEHASFYLNVDGEEINFTQREYQLQSDYVHLENFKPHIVHKHSENVTWGMFLSTIDISFNTSCVNFKDRSECGNLSVILNGDEGGINSEIQQGDNFAILLNSSEKSEDYMNKQLPEGYTKKVSTRGI